VATSRILGIETSCDETSAAVLRVEDGRPVLGSLVILSQDIHRVFGGVVPELASREHLRTIGPVVDRALAEAGIGLTQVDGIAVTAGPGIANTITALKNAQLAQSPVILIGGAAPTALQGRGALQDIDQRPLVAPHVKLFRKVVQVRGLGPALEEAFQVARSGVPGPVFVECPVDLLYDEASIRQWYTDAAGKGKGLADGALRPGYTGIRPKITAKGEPAADFMIQGPTDHGVANMVNLYGIESPGLTSSLAIADHAAALLGL